MTDSLFVRVAMTFGGLVAAASLSAGIASAAPGDGPLIQTTCSYGQIYGALKVEAPELAAALDQNPQAQTKLQNFIALPVDQRQQRLHQFLDRNPDVQAKIDEKQNTPEGQQKVQMLARIAATCHNY
jgi:hemophore-related protein